MALQSFPNGLGVVLTPTPFPVSALAQSTMNATGESVTAIGHVRLQAGSGTKTISSAGGKIHWRATGTVTFVQAGTLIRVGIQDVNPATGIEDGTFDVSADLVGGVDTITSNGFNSTAMESGSKNITHGDLIAVSVEMVTQSPVDSVIAAMLTGNTSGIPGLQVPYSTIDVGAGPTKSANWFPVTIEFDDGSVGWLEVSYLVPGTNASLFGTAISFGSDSTPDEYAMIFSVPFKTSIVALMAALSDIATTDAFEIIIYSDPLGTPVAEVTIVADPVIVNNVAIGLNYYVQSITPFELEPNTEYAIAVRPTTTNQITIGTYVFDSGNERLLRPTQLGENWYLGTRSDETGAFSPTTTSVPLFGIILGQFEDGVGLAGGSWGFAS